MSNHRNVLVVNCGSSSLKYQLIDMTDEGVLARGICEKIGLGDGSHTYIKTGSEKIVYERTFATHLEAVESVLKALTNKDTGVLESLDEIEAVGHRVVQGADVFKTSVLIDDEVIEKIDKLSSLAPLHNPAHVAGMKVCAKKLPTKPMVAVFDTSFHQTMPEYAYRYGIDYDMADKYEIRKYGAHGTSHQYVANESAKFLGKNISELKVIVCHLGNGSSITAVKDGKSIDTSMGFTPLAGPIMGTRCGSMDPSVIPYVIEKGLVKPEELNNWMNKKSGVYAVSGVSSDFRDLRKAKEGGNRRATVALDMFCYGVKQYIGSYVAVLNGVDVIAFTAGIGENDYTIREKVVKDLDNLGIKLDEGKNKMVQSIPADVSAEDSKVKILVVPTNEELMIARQTIELIEK